MQILAGRGWWGWGWGWGAGLEVAPSTPLVAYVPVMY
jgi:opacity protein-like surface antigen